ncbi:c-type cytochrome [Bdellovibrio sp. HCB337]|uniref:c-type cytochrome n=1 Tax=Bdellovibrio sp. HCB337 TaxID=3394358 RepID=UPI0039A71064
MSESREEYNRGGMIAFIFSMAFVFCFFIYIVAIHPGVELGEKVVDPTAVAQGTAEAAFDIATVKEPWVANEQVVAHGKKLFATNCAMCHGNEGKGDGPAGAGLNPKPRNLVEGKWTQGSGAIAHFKVVTNGIPGTSMASYAHFKVADRWALVQFIDSITQNKGSDKPEQVAEFAKTAK